MPPHRLLRIREGEHPGSPFAKRVEFGVGGLQFCFDLGPLLDEISASLVGDRLVEGDELLEIALDLARKEHTCLAEQLARLFRIEEDLTLVERSDHFLAVMGQGIAPLVWRGDAPVDLVDQLPGLCLVLRPEIEGVEKCLLLVDLLSLEKEEAIDFAARLLTDRGPFLLFLLKSPFDNYRWATRRSSRAPMATWIMASDTSRRFS